MEEETFQEKRDKVFRIDSITYVVAIRENPFIPKQEFVENEKKYVLTGMRTEPGGAWIDGKDAARVTLTYSACI